MKSRQELSERAVGCLLGLACGDALARPLAGLRNLEVSRRYGSIRSYVEVPVEENEPQRQAHKGIHGSVTTLALAALDSLLYGGPSGPDFARRLTALSFPRNYLLPWGALRGAAPSLVRAVDSHARGDDWRLAGVRGADATCLTSVLPLGLLVGDELADVIDIAVEMALVTQRDPRSVAAAAAMVGIVRHVIEQRTASSKGIAKAALQSAELACQSLASRHSGVVASSPDAARAAISLALGRAENESHPFDIDCRDAPEIALAAVVGAVCLEQDLMDLLSQTCARGGAADILVPAIAAVVGARSGVEHLPLGLVDGLVANQEISLRAKAMFESGRPALPPLYDLEIALAEREGRWRHQLPPPPPAPKRDQLNLL